MPRRGRDHRVLRGRLAPSRRSSRATSGHLIWCNSNGRERFAHFIDAAKHTLFVQNERYQDTVIIERLVRAARRGVKVHVMARPPHTLKREKLVEGVGGLRIMDDVGIKIHKLKHLKLHGKMLLADGVARDRRLDQLRGREPRRTARAGDRVRDENVVDRLQRSPGTTGNIRTRSISRTRDCWPTSRSRAPANRQSSGTSEQFTPRRRRDRRLMTTGPPRGEHREAHVTRNARKPVQRGAH